MYVVLFDLCPHCISCFSYYIKLSINVIFINSDVLFKLMTCQRAEKTLFRIDTNYYKCYWLPSLHDIEQLSSPQFVLSASALASVFNMIHITERMLIASVYFRHYLDCDKPLIENDVNVKLTSSFGKPNDARMNSEYGWCTSRDGGKYLQVKPLTTYTFGNFGCATATKSRTTTRFFPSNSGNHKSFFILLLTYTTMLKCN